VGYDPGFLATQTQIIKSKKVGRQVVEKLNLDETYQQYFPDMGSDVSVFFKGTRWFKNLLKVSLKLAGIGPKETASSQQAPLTEEERKEALIGSLAQMISGGIFVERGMEEERGNVVTVSFVSTNPVLSADIVNTVSAAYKGFLMEMRTKSTSETLEWLEEKAAIQRRKLEASEQQLQQYKKDQGIYTVGDKEVMFPGKIASLSDRLTQVQAEMEEMASLYDEISRMSLPEALNLPEVLQSVTVSSLRKNITTRSRRSSTCPNPSATSIPG